ncbi:putative gustatory receptor 2a [Polistes fuscatus]|uniref:putative gustatory receptor 2a n=1 Tax=Polistes fuscatus TaxID=30207 RepID=UPI001CA90CFB|nr:putative gustatory receptor 2a [Polistes fuscatus]
MLNTTIDLPQHKRVFQIWNNDFPASEVDGTCKSNKNITKIRKIREIHMELIKCAENINDAYGLHILMSVSAACIVITASSYVDQLNELLKSMLTTTIDSPQHKRIINMRNNWKNDSASADIHRTYESNEDVVKIKMAKKLHMELMKCAKNINDAYGLHILLSVSTSTILITIMSYNLYNNVITGINRKNMNAVISLTYWMLFYVTKTIIMSHLCATTSAELSDFTLQLIQNPLTFTSCGFFHINHTLIRNVIVSVTTYLVILIQFGNIPPQVFSENSIL